MVCEREYGPVGSICMFFRAFSGVGLQETAKSLSFLDRVYLFDVSSHLRYISPQVHPDRFPTTKAPLSIEREAQITLADEYRYRFNDVLC